MSCGPPTLRVLMGAVERKIWIDGALVPWADATVHVLSHSLQRGSLVFDYLSVHATPAGDALFRLDEHIERFLRSCELTGLRFEYDAGTIRRAVLETVRANPGARAVKMSGYLASVEIDVVAVDDRVTLAIAAYDPEVDIAARLPGGAVAKRSSVRLWIEKERKNRRADIVPPQAKTAANYASPMVAKARARAAGYDEILLVDEFGAVAEGPTTNVFLVDAAGRVLTPAADRVLLGVTRDSVLQIAQHAGYPVAEAVVRPEDLFTAAEVFLTGTTAGVLPVESIDGEPIGGGVPGPVSAALQARFRRIVAGEDEDFIHWLTRVDADSAMEV